MPCTLIVETNLRLTILLQNCSEKVFLIEAVMNHIKMTKVMQELTSKVQDNFCTWPDHFLVWLEPNSPPDKEDLTCP